MLDRYELERQLLSAFQNAFWNYSLDGSFDSNNMQIGKVVTKALIEVLLPYLTDTPPVDIRHDARFTKLLESLQLLGDQVAEHNRVLLELTAPKAAQPATHWQCYCGTVNAMGSRCSACGGR